MARMPHSKRIVVLDVVAAYNRQGLVTEETELVAFAHVQDLLSYPALVSQLAEQNAEEILMDLYVARRFWMQ